MSPIEIPETASQKNDALSRNAQAMSAAWHLLAAQFHGINNE